MKVGMVPFSGSWFGCIWMRVSPSWPPNMVVVVDSGVVVDVDWVGVEDMVELVEEVEAEVSIIVGDVLLADVLVDSVVVSDVLELADEARDGHFCNCFLYVFFTSKDIMRSTEARLAVGLDFLCSLQKKVVDGRN